MHDLKQLIVLQPCCQQEGNGVCTILITLKQPKQHTVYRRFGFASEAFIRSRSIDKQYVVLVVLE